MAQMAEGAELYSGDWTRGNFEELNLDYALAGMDLLLLADEF